MPVTTSSVPKQEYGSTAADSRTGRQAHTAVTPVVRWSVLTGAALSVVLSIGLALRLVPVGSRAGHYVYPYVRSFAPELLWPFCTVAAVVVAGLWLSARWHGQRPLAVVAGWMAAAVPVQLLLRVNDDAPLGAIVTSTRANGFWDAAHAYTAGEFLARHADVVEQLDSHVRTNMAGKTVFYQLLAAVAGTPFGAGVLIVGVSSMSALLLYLIARDLLDPRTALYALVLVIMVPGKVYFLPILNTVAPVAVLAALWLMVRYLRCPHWTWAAGMGTLLYLTVFFEPLPMALGLVFVGLLGWALATGRISGAALRRLCAAAVGAFVAVHLLMRQLAGYDLLADFSYVFVDANNFNGNGHRPYQVWVVRNLWDFAVSAGLASVVLVVACLLDAVRRGLARPAAVVAVCAAATLAAVDLIGVNRGETVRLWIFLAVFWQLPAAWLCARTSRMWPIALTVTVTVLQVAVGLAMIGFVRI